MRDDIRTEVLANITRDYRFAEPRGEWLQKGKCPQCGQKELFTSYKKPWVLRCSRANRCGWEGEVKDLYPEIFDSWSNRHEATEQNPNAAADAYLSHARGLDLRRLRGAYAQESYFDRGKNIASATVRFDLPGGGWWERLIDQPGRFDRKARFAPGKSYSGQVWLPRDVTIDQIAAGNEVFFAEGIFDCSALWQAFNSAELADKGLFAVSAMSCNNWPEKFLDALRKAIANGPTPTHQPKLIFAFDVGKAGTDYTRKFVKRARDEGWEASAAQPRPEGEDDKLDWNNLLVRDRLTEKHLAEYRANGEVLVAADAFEKAWKLWQQQAQAKSQFPFVFNSETYWAEFSPKKIDEVYRELMENPEYAGKDAREVRQEAAEQVGTIKRICSASFRTLYFQRNPATEESHYYIRVDFPTDRNAIKAPFSGGALSASAEFKKRMISVAPGALWLGSGEQLDRIVGTQTRKIKTVETLEFTGYDRKREVYVLGDFAVRRGRVFCLNDEDFFDFGDCALKLATTERMLEIEYDADAKPVSWFPVLIDAFGMNGLVTTAYWIMTLFAEQIRIKAKNFPFLEMSGLPGTGKTTLLEFLWGTLGRDNYEGFDPTKGTTAAIARNFGKVSNLPVVLIEGDRNESAHHSKKFEWEELKSLYNGRATRSRGVKNGGMETFEPLFRGSIIIAQNDPVSASPAVLERIMALHFDKSGFSDTSQAAADQLKQWPSEEISGFILYVLRHEEQFMKVWAECFARYKLEIKQITGVTNIRLTENHAYLAAALTAMRQFLPISDGLHSAGLKFIADMTAARQRVVSSEHPVVEKFWQIFDYLVEIETDAQREDRPLNNHRKAEEYIAVSLPQFFERCRAHGQVPPTEDDLRRHLKTSKGRKFVACKPVNAPGGKHFYCWVFTRPLSETAII